MVRVVIVSNELPPYRIPLFEKLGLVSNIAFRVIFCTRREPNRRWELPQLNFDHQFLNEKFIEKSGRYIHNNPDVFPALKRFSPDVVVTTGFNPTHLYAFAYAAAKSLPHIAMTDGTLESEQGLSGLHRAIRRLVYARTKSFIYASDGGRRLYQSYRIDPQRCFRSALCIDNAAFSPIGARQEKTFDFIFCGRIEAVKNPFFAFNVALETARKLGRKVSILFVGMGAEEERVKAEAAQHSGLVEVAFQGFTLHHELPSLYRSARLFLFPTLWDPWGVVVNEACAAGLPAILSSHSGAADELVRDGENGFVCDLDVSLWAERAASLLTRDDLYRKFSRRSLRIVSDYSYENAVAGIVAACRFSMADGRRPAASASSYIKE